MKSAILTLMLASLSNGAVHAQARLPTIPPEDYNDEQRQAAEEFEAARNRPVFGPFEPLMHSPSVMNLSRAMGDYLRYNSAIGNTLSELAILITAREWTQDYEWYVHYPIALQMGISKDIADAIANGRRPDGLSEDETIIYDFCLELLHNKRVSDHSWELAQQRFGNKGVVDITAIVGYYSMLAMQMNMAEYPLPGDAVGLSRFP